MSLSYISRSDDHAKGLEGTEEDRSQGLEGFMRQWQGRLGDAPSHHKKHWKVPSHPSSVSSPVVCMDSRGLTAGRRGRMTAVPSVVS